MELPSYFIDFLKGIRLTDPQRNDASTGHRTLRKRLKEDPDYKGHVVADFIQGSYRRATAVRPKGDKRSDVDVIVVSNLDYNEWTPKQVLDHFEGFVKKYYEGKYEIQGRSIGIKLSYVELDLVITAAPSEAQQNALRSAAVQTDRTIEEAADWLLSTTWSENALVLAEAAAEPAWKKEPLLIPDRDTQEWQRTDPLTQIEWAAKKNRSCNKHFVNVVKAIKWWRLLQLELPKYPKGYPLERLIGECCPDGINSVAEGVTLTFENFVYRFEPDILSERTPVLPDYGVPEHDVLKRVDFDDFKALYDAVVGAAKAARSALDEMDLTASACQWRELFGSKFPEPKDGCKSGDAGGGGGGAAAGFIAPTTRSTPDRTRFA